MGWGVGKGGYTDHFVDTNNMVFNIYTREHKSLYITLTIIITIGGKPNEMRQMWLQME